MSPKDFVFTGRVSEAMHAVVKTVASQREDPMILPKPSISKRPAGDLTWGQDVSVTCSISTQHLGGTFTLQQTSGSFRKSQTSSTNSATFNIPQVTFSNEGSYQCQYQTRVSSRDFNSPQSDSIRLSVTGIVPVSVSDKSFKSRLQIPTE
uniref:Ig-like domain-containing protein n=1 Tax=Maylandia zebra TaxID=106582 RepID=A0A3P9D8N8_9CICH